MSDQEEQNQESENISKLKEELDTVNNNWKRALADFENFKRQKERESKELLEFAKEVTVVKLLPTLDTLEQALKHVPVYTTPSANADTPPIAGGDSLQYSPPSVGGVPTEGGGGGKVEQDFAKAYKNWQVGIGGILMQIDKTLSELGVKKIEAVGKKFDPNLHEAVKEVEGEEDGMVVDQLQTGFELNGKVIRPAQVVVSRK